MKGTLLHVRARQVGVSVIVLRQWHSRYLHGGLSTLVPTEWSELPEAVWPLIDQRYSALGDLAEAETITPEDIHRLASVQGWTVRQAQRWLLRYRVGGMLGLAPNTVNLSNPGKPLLCRKRRWGQRVNHLDKILKALPRLKGFGRWQIALLRLMFVVDLLNFTTIDA